MLFLRTRAGILRIKPVDNRTLFAYIEQIMSNKELPFGLLIRSFRLESRMSLRQLADKIGFAYGHLSDLERGIKPPPSEKKIIKIADTLGINKDDLLQSASKVDPQVTDYVSGQPKAVDFLRTAQARDFSNGDWDNLKDVDPRVAAYVSGEPKAIDFFDWAQARDFSNGDWDKLKKIAELSNLGREKAGKEEK